MKSEAEQSEYLELCLRTYYMAHRKKHKEFYGQKRDEIKAALETHFGPKLAGKIIMSGSLMKSTELNTKFDVDLIVPFKADAFTLETMSTEVNHFLKAKFTSWDNWDVATQRVSVGIRYEPCLGTSVKIDVVPGREIGLAQYAKDRFLKLYDNQNKAHFQTNIQAQVDALRSAGGARRLIRLLKIWKLHGSGPNVKSFVLEMLVVEAFKTIPRHDSSLIFQLKYVLQFIKDNLPTIRLVDPGNSSNIVSDLLVIKQKDAISKEAETVLAKITQKPGSIQHFFPLNEDFLEESRKMTFKKER